MSFTMYVPAALEATARTYPVASLVSVTLAAATDAPLGSVTAPARAPVPAVCPRRAGGKKKQAAPRRKQKASGGRRSEIARRNEEKSGRKKLLRFMEASDPGLEVLLHQYGKVSVANPNKANAQGALCNR